MGSRLKAILFDLDGTIIDTELAAARVVVESFSEWGVQVELSDSQFVTGRTWESAFEFLFQKYPLSVDRAQAQELIIQRYREALHKELCLVPGSVAAVLELSKSFPLALVSGSYRAEIVWALEKLGIHRCFQVVLGAEDYERSKPAPDGYQKALAQLGVKPDEALVFEDSEAGIASGVTAGCWVVAIAAANHFGHDTSKAHHRIGDLKKVTTEWVRALQLPVR